MEQMTITEALSEINLVKKKITSSREKVKGMLIKYEHLPDPFASQGGSAQVIASELQSMRDLSKRLQALRAAISRANLTNYIQFKTGSYTSPVMTIHDVLIWKRELIKGELEFKAEVSRTIKQHLDTAARQPQVYKDEAGVVQIVKSLPNVNYPAWLEEEQRDKDCLEKIDGQLSLKNATIVIEI